MADFLSFRATGDEARGVCATACKWGRVDRHGWSREFFNRVGLGDLCEDDFSRIGRRVLMPGEALEAVVSPEAAVQLGGEPAAGMLFAFFGLFFLTLNLPLGSDFRRCRAFLYGESGVGVGGCSRRWRWNARCCWAPEARPYSD